MNSILMKIQNTVGKYAEVMSRIAGTDVEVVDIDYLRVAGTGYYAEGVNQDTSGEAYVYRKVMETGKREVIYSPGEEPVCSRCPHYRNCPEEIEISMPVQLKEEGEIIGVIGLVGTTPEQKRRILEDETTYLELLEQISDFISAKALEELTLEKEKKSRKSLEVLLQTLRSTVNYMEQGALILDENGRILQINREAGKQLGAADLQEKGTGVEIFSDRIAELAPTGYRIGKEEEYLLKIEGREYLVMGNRYQVPGPEQEARTLLLFRGSHEVREQMREIGAVIPSPEKTVIIGSSPATEKLRRDISRVAKSKSTVLITGGSGTGKERVAEAIWRESERKDRKFIAINCAAIPEALLESELFGYVKGAFSGADPNGRMGKFELADKGVIFLDEIGDMPTYLQTKLLRVLQERKIVRIGSNILTPIDVRVLAATNRDLKQMIREGKFREDLYYRLNVIPIYIEPLSERKEDIQDLVLHFAARFSKAFDKTAWRVTDRAMELLERYSWPGNVRELENAVEYMVNMMGDDGVLGEQTIPRGILLETVGSLPLESDVGESPGRTAETKSRETQAGRAPADREVIPLKELEQRELLRALDLFGRTTDGKRRAAAQLGISLAKLYRLEGTIKTGKISQTEN